MWLAERSHKQKNLFQNRYFLLLAGIETVRSTLFVNTRDMLDHLALGMVAVVSPTLLAFKLAFDEGMVLYSRKRVLRQLDYVQVAMLIPGDAGSRLTMDVKTLFIRDGNDLILTGHHKLFWPVASRVSVR